MTSHFRTLFLSNLFLQNLSCQTRGAAYLRVRLIRRCLRYVLNQEPSTPHNLLMGVKTIWELCLFQVALLVSFQGLQMGIFIFWTERDWSRKSCYGNTIEGVILFLLRCTFMVPSFENTASIFPEKSFIQYFTIFRCKQYDVITDLICIVEKHQYL